MSDGSATTAKLTFAGLHALLDPRERRFVDEYLECCNATLAARRVWSPKTARQKGSAALRRPDVAAAVEAGLREQRERTHNDPDRIIRELMLVAYADPADLVDASGNPLPLRKLAPEIRRAIASIDFETQKVSTEDIVDGAEGQAPTSKKRVTTTTRVVKYKLVAKTPTLELLGKRLKMFSDRLEIDATDTLAALIKGAFNRPAPGAPAIQE